MWYNQERQVLESMTMYQLSSHFRFWPVYTFLVDIVFQVMHQVVACPSKGNTVPAACTINDTMGSQSTCISVCGLLSGAKPRGLAVQPPPPGLADDLYLYTVHRHVLHCSRTTTTTARWTRLIKNSDISEWTMDPDSNL